MTDHVVAVFGASFVSGLLDHLQYGSPVRLSPRDIASRLRVGRVVKEVHLAGVGGDRIMDVNLKQLPSHMTKTLAVGPTIIILNYGSNDLTRGSHPLDVAVKTHDLAETLLTDYPTVQHVVLCSVIHRTHNLGVLSKESFQEKSYLLNGFLNNLCDVQPSMTYHVHKGFWSSEVSDWSRDGIHPNKPGQDGGRIKFKRSLRRAIFQAVTTASRQAKQI